MYDGYKRRHDILEDLFIINAALPAYRCNFIKKPPKYEDLTKHRRRLKAFSNIDPELLKFWKERL